MVRETRHLWVGNLPENVRDEKIIEHFKRYGRVESVKILPKRGSDGGVAAFVDFVDIKSAQKAHNAVNKMGDRDLRTDYNEPGTIPGAARVLDETVSITSRSREVSGFRGGGGGPAYGPPQSLHTREGRYERRLDGASETRERSYDHSAYGHHERGTASFERTRHYDQDYYREPRERASGLQHGIFYNSRRSPSRFDTHESRYESRTREAFTLPSVVHRDVYRNELSREVRGRRADRTYQNSRSRSPHSSQSRNQSPQRLASQASRPARSPSGSGSRSRSSSSDSLSSSSSTSSDSDSSSTSSDDSPARSVQSAAVPAPPVQPLLLSLDKDEPRKSFGIKVQNLPVRSTDTSLKDGLFHEFKKYGKVTSVQIHGVSEERYGLVFFRQQEDQEKALNASKGKLFFGMQIEVTAWVGPETESENEFRPLDDRIDEFHPKATRTLFIGNLEKTTTHADLHTVFQRFGEIVDIDIKKLNGVPQYAFLQYSDITSVCKAIKKMDGEYLGSNRLKLGFGKSMPTNCVWIDGLSSNVSDPYLTRHFSRYGPVLKVVYDRFKGMALIIYSEIEFAQAAVKETKGRKVGGTIVKVDFANQESQLAFYGSMETSGQDIREIYEIISERRGDETRRGSYHEFTSTDRTYYDTVRATSTYQEETRREYPARSREFFQDWDTYPENYYEQQRYYDETREYRDYRDPYEQDITDYRHRRERERERERFETDRERDTERRQIERSQSPAHSRRPQSPAGSPAASERITSDAERRIYSRSSDRSGSCSSVSPSRLEKLEKARAERYGIKSEKLDKDRAFESERSDKEKRLLKKERTEKLEKDKVDRAKRKSKNHSTSPHSSETDQDNDKEQSLDKQKGSSKLLTKEKNDKDATLKNRLDLMPCVVLTRVNEKEGKVFEPPGLEKGTKAKNDNDSIKSPSSDTKTQIIRLEQAKFEPIKADSRSKVPKDKTLSSHVEVVDSKQKLKKHLKTEPPTEGSSAADLDKLEARKRRFADANLKCDRQKLEVRRNNAEEDDLRLGSRKPLDPASSRDFNMLREEYDRKGQRKEPLKKDRKSKSERLNINSPKDSQDHSISARSNSDLQFRLGELIDESFDSNDSTSKKMSFIKNMQRHVQMGDDLDKDTLKDDRKVYSSHAREALGLERSGAEEKLGIDIDSTQSYRKQMEQSRKLKQQMELEMLKNEKFGSPSKEAEEYEKRSLVHEVGKPPQDVTDDSPPSKKKKPDHFDYEITKPGRNYRSTRQISDEAERTCSPSVRHFPFNDDDYTIGSPRMLPIREFKGVPQVDEKNLFPNVGLKEDHYKVAHADSFKKEHVSDSYKGKFSAVSPDEDYAKWESHHKQDSNRMDFPSNIVTRKRPRDLEPGEVPSDSDDDGDRKSPKVSSILDGSRYSFLLRDGEDKRDKEDRLSGSLERHRFLDKTITPDTKALLERAKSLSSSREENWSFLEWDSKLASFRTNKEREKVESTPRPIPSWYMKKKKIKTDPDGKSDDKKDEHKEEEQEKQELFASRFLHSSIFEQDSKRLQHLEKSEETDLGLLRPYGRQLSSDGIIGASDLVQEPVVLFHSRFIELTRMQQKEKEKEQKPKEQQEKPEEREIPPKTPEPEPESKEKENKLPIPAVPTPAPPPAQPSPQPPPQSAPQLPPQSAPQPPPQSAPQPPPQPSPQPPPQSAPQPPPQSAPQPPPQSAPQPPPQSAPQPPPQSAPQPPPQSAPQPPPQSAPQPPPQSAPQPPPQPSPQPAPQPPPQPSPQSPPQSAPQPPPQPSPQPATQPSPQPPPQPTSRPAPQPSPQPPPQSALQPPPQLTSQPAPQPSPQPPPQSAPQPPPQPSPRSPPQSAPQPATQPSPQPPPQPTSQPAPQPSPQPPPQSAPQPATHPSSQTASQASPQPAPLPDPVAPIPDKPVPEKAPSPPPPPPVSIVEEKPTETSDPVVEDVKPPTVVNSITSPVALHSPIPVENIQSADESEVQPSSPAPKEETSAESTSLIETKPPTPGACFSEVLTDHVTSPPQPLASPPPTASPSKPDSKIEDVVEPLEETTPVLTVTEAESSEKTETVPEEAEPLIPENDVEAEPPVTAKNKKASKGKRSIASDKPATRKSVRIDREKRNRSASPRVEPQKHLEAKNEHDRSSRSAAKSPSSVPEPEVPEPSLPLSRTRRNVRSVYATTGDNDGLSKESSDAPRSTRKRSEKEVPDTPVPAPTTPRRGRPPKVRKNPSPNKVETVKQELEESESKDLVENVKSLEGWRSPRSQKSSQSHSPVSSNHQSKKVKGDLSPQPNDSVRESNEQCPESNDTAAEEEKSKPAVAKEDVTNMNDAGLDKGPVDIPITETLEKTAPQEKALKSKPGRTKNSKTLRLRKIEIRLNADEVKGALRPHDGGESVVVSPVKIKSPPKEDNLSPPFTKPEESCFPETPEKEALKEPKISPEEAFLARQIELEQAVENIEKITETSVDIPSFKEPQEGEASEPRPEEEGDKPAHQASETELAAAIGSIICDISADAETFPPAPQYPEGEAEVSESSTTPAAPPPVDVPEADRSLELPDNGTTNTDSTETIVSPPAEPAEHKEPDQTLSEPPNTIRETEPEAETAPKRGRAPRKPKRVRRNSKKPDPAESNIIHEAVPRVEKRLSDDGQKEALVESPEKPSLADTCLNSSSDTIAKDTEEESKEEDRPDPTNVCDSPPPLIIDDVSQSSFKLRSSTENAPITPPRSTTTPPLPITPGKSAPAVSVAPSPHSAPAILPDWMVRHEENSNLSTPPPALPPDTKASDIDTSSSTLRKILMEPKYVSSSSATPSIVTAAISEPVSASHVEEPVHPQVEALKPVSEEKSAVPLANTVIPPAAEAPVIQEKVTIVTPKATSVISRMPPSYAPDDLPRITLAKHSAPHQPAPPCIPSQKIKQRQNTNDSRPCVKQTMTVIEDRPTETGPSPGLRVNTSQGVMLLSYSGNKIEGPQRITAKISPIPPASAVDIEMQQAATKTKQEPSTPSQVLSKGAQTPTNYQPYNASPVISSIKQERLEKSEPSHITVPNASSQPGAVKVLTQNAPPVLMHGQMLPGQIVSSGKKITEIKMESKGLQPTNMSPHHPSLSGKLPPEANHVGSGNSTPSDRGHPHISIKSEPHSPCTAGHSPSPYTRTCHPSVSNSPALTSNPSVMLAPGIPVPPYMSSMHTEQTVIMPPHSVTQSLGHLAQGDVRINTPPLPQIQYGMRPETLHSPRAAMQAQMDVRPQRSNTPQSAQIRDMVLPTMSSQHAPDEDLHYHHPVRGAAHVQSDVLVLQPEYRMPSSGMRLDPYGVAQDVILPRDVRMMMPSHIASVGDHHQEARQSRTPEGPVKTPPASKTPQPVKDMSKASDVKLPHPQHGDARMLSGLNLSQQVVMPHGVPPMHSLGGSFHDYRPVYTDIRTYHPAAQLSHPQFPAASPIGLQSRSMTPSQVGPDGDHPHSNASGRSKTPQVCQDSKIGQPSVNEQPHHPALSRHPSQLESHILQRAPLDTPQTSYPSPVTINMKHDLPSPHHSQKQPAFMPSSAGTITRTDSQPHIKPDPSQRSVDMVQLLTKYPIVWQGLLALKNDTAAVQLHFVSGNNVLAHRSLPAPEGGPPLRIAQRMRLEATQLEGVARRMTVESDYCLLLALPCGRDQEDVVNQTESLKAAFITYLQAKQAAGIINVPNPGSNQPAYVLQIFPPCEFSESHLSRLAPDLLASISNISPHLMIVIALA